MTIDTKALALAAAVLLLAASTGAEPKAGAAADGQSQAAAQPADKAGTSSEEEAKKKAVQEKMKAVLNTSTPVSPFAEVTEVDGTIPVDLRGAWLLVANAKFGEVQKVSKFRTFVQLFKVDSAADGKVAIHLLDVRLPMAIANALEEANTKLAAWEPKAADLQALKGEWSKLPPYTEKTLNEHLYLDVKYALAAPDRYDPAIPKGERSPDILDGSTFALHVLERYRPGRVPADSPVNITQVAGRTSIYGLKPDGKNGDRLAGRAALRFAAVGAGSAVPLSFPSRVVLYRLAPPASS